MIWVKKAFDRIIEHALDEDGVWTDWTTLGLLYAEKKVRATIWAREDLVAAGLNIAGQTFSMLSDGCDISWMPVIKDGQRIEAEKPIASIEAEAWQILGGERTALNFLQRLSGIATTTKGYVDRIAGTKAKIVDTRKTTPGMRVLEKYAVFCGGGRNHRFGLNDGCLIKDNHIRLAGGIKEAVEGIRQRVPHLINIEVEVEDLDQVKECLCLRVQAVLLDNMKTDEMARAVEIIDGRMLVEASGGIDLEHVEEVAHTGVDLISVGALTHSARSVDISLELD